MVDIRHYIRSSSFKMALFFTIMCGLTVIMLGYFIYYFSHNFFINTVENAIDTDMRYTRLIYDETLDKEKFLRSLNKTASDTKHLYLFSDQSDPQLLQFSRNLPVRIAHLTEGLLFFERDGLQYAAKIQTFPDGRNLLIGLDITPMLQDHHRMIGLSIGSIVMMLIVISVSYIISRFVVTRTNRIILQAQDIMKTGDLSRRLDVDSNWDDLSYMTNALNLFLSRIEDLMQGVRQVSDNIAHDLRTPLTRMRNTIEQLKNIKHADNTITINQIGVTLSNEADHLLDTFNALLRISRIESGHQHSPFESVELDQILHDVIDLYEPLAEQKMIGFHVELSHVSSQGDRHLLFQAFANILDNAVKFSSEQSGDIIISLSHTAEEACIAIHDQGPGIPTSQHVKIFERYYRVDTSRNLPGSGLGLSLAMAIIKLHGGTIDLPVVETGTKFVITLPLRVPIA